MLFVSISEIKLDNFYHLKYLDYDLHNVSGDASFFWFFMSNSGAHTGNRIELFV